MNLDDLVHWLGRAPLAHEMWTPANFTESNTGCVISALQEMQIIYIAQQHQLLELVISAANMRGKRKDLFVRPDLFDGIPAGIAFWLDYYECACNKNRWTTNKGHVHNMRPFRCGNAQK